MGSGESTVLSWALKKICAFPPLPSYDESHADTSVTEMILVPPSILHRKRIAPLYRAAVQIKRDNTHKVIRTVPGIE